MRVADSERHRLPPFEDKLLFTAEALRLLQISDSRIGVPPFLVSEIKSNMQPVGPSGQVGYRCGRCNTFLICVPAPCCEGLSPSSQLKRRGYAHFLMQCCS